MAWPAAIRKKSANKKVEHLLSWQFDTITEGAINSSLSTYITCREDKFGTDVKTVLTCAALPITIADDAGVAQYGGAGKVYDFPAGLIKFKGATITGSLTLGATGTITATWAGGVALGSAAATTGATLTSTEATWMAEADVAAATASVATIAGVSSTEIAPYNGTSTAGDVYFNLVVDDDATHTAGTGTFTGTITMWWTNLGDI